MARTLINHLTKMFIALGMYWESFEKPFLECSSEFYGTEGVKYMQQSDVPGYLKHVEVAYSLSLSLCVCVLLCMLKLYLTIHFCHNEVFQELCSSSVSLSPY